MGARHFMLGGIPVTLIISIVLALTKGHVKLTPSEALYLGSLAITAGTGLAHMIEKKKAVQSP